MLHALLIDQVLEDLRKTQAYLSRRFVRELDLFFCENFALTNLEYHIPEGSRRSMSTKGYFEKMLDPSLNRRTVEKLRAD